MTLIELSEALAAYESVENKDERIQSGINADEKTIFNDKVRIIISKDSDERDKWIHDKLSDITYLILIHSPIDYYQGMFEIAFVFVKFYFEEDLEKKYDEEEENVSEEKIESGEEENESGEEKESEEKEEAKKIEGNRSVLISDSVIHLCGQRKFEMVSHVITNIFRDKYLPLTKDGFKLYTKYSEIAAKLLKKKGVIMEEKMIGYAFEAVLTWFTRTFENVEDVYKIMAILISCPVNMPFIMLVHYGKEIYEKKKITSVEPDLYEKLIDIEVEFITIISKEKTFKLSKKHVLFGCAVFVAVVGVIIIAASKSKNTGD